MKGTIFVCFICVIMMLLLMSCDVEKSNANESPTETKMESDRGAEDTESNCSELHNKVDAESNTQETNKTVEREEEGDNNLSIELEDIPLDERIYVSEGGIEGDSYTGQLEFDFPVFDSTLLFSDGTYAIQIMNEVPDKAIIIGGEEYLFRYVERRINEEFPEKSYDIYTTENQRIICEFNLDGTLLKYYNTNRADEYIEGLDYEAIARQFLTYWYGESCLDDYDVEVRKLSTGNYMVRYMKHLHGCFTDDRYTVTVLPNGVITAYEMCSPGCTDSYANISETDFEETFLTLNELARSEKEPKVVMANDGYLYMELEDIEGRFFYTRLQNGS